MSAPGAYHALLPAAGCSRRMAHLTRERPKSLLEIGGKAIVEHSLDVLASRGIERVTIVVGYRRELIERRIGERRGPLAIDYVVNEDFDTTEHGWSVRLGLEHWARDPRPILMLDADNLYDPAMLDVLLGSPRRDALLVDGGFDDGGRDEELVVGRGGRVAGLVRGVARGLVDYAGGFVGINRFDPGFAHGLLAHMRGLPDLDARRLKYERVIDGYLRASGAELACVDVGGLAWINVNHEDELAAARAVAARMSTGAALGR